MGRRRFSRWFRGMRLPAVVTAVGSKVTKFKVGDRVGVGCFVDYLRRVPGM